VNDGDPLTRVNIDALNTAGVKIVFYPATVRAAVAKTALTVMSCLKRTGNTVNIAADMMALIEFSNLLDLDKYQVLEKKLAESEIGFTPIGKGGERNV
jgi:2-methylisocitrate lyase-like PEP mutase family enzyme